MKNKEYRILILLTISKPTISFFLFWKTNNIHLYHFTLFQFYQMAFLNENWMSYISIHTTIEFNFWAKKCKYHLEGHFLSDKDRLWFIFFTLSTLYSLWTHEFMLNVCSTVFCRLNSSTFSPNIFRIIVKRDKIFNFLLQ